LSKPSPHSCHFIIIIISGISIVVFDRSRDEILCAIIYDTAKALNGNRGKELEALSPDHSPSSPQPPDEILSIGIKSAVIADVMGQRPDILKRRKESVDVLAELWPPKHRGPPRKLKPTF
jgi:hypothetical protein